MGIRGRIVKFAGEWRFTEPPHLMMGGGGRPAMESSMSAESAGGLANELAADLAPAGFAPRRGGGLLARSTRQIRVERIAVDGEAGSRRQRTATVDSVACI